MWCRCGKQKSFTAKKVDGEFNYEFWVCSNCDKPSLQVFQKVTGMYAPKSAEALLSVNCRYDGIHELRWALADKSRATTLSYHPYPFKQFEDEEMNVGRHLLLETWQLLDSKVNLIMEDTLNAAPEKSAAKNEARGIAEVLAMFMKPFFESADDIVREAVKRHKGGPDHETPGLAEKLWSPHTKWDGTPFDENKQKKSKSKLSDSDVQSIKDGIASGILDEKACASIFKVSIDEIKSVLSS
jgi:hypothetical protein